MARRHPARRSDLLRRRRRFRAAACPSPACHGARREPDRSGPAAARAAQGSRALHCESPRPAAPRGDHGRSPRAPRSRRGPAACCARCTRPPERRGTAFRPPLSARVAASSRRTSTRSSNKQRDCPRSCRIETVVGTAVGDGATPRGRLLFKIHGSIGGNIRDAASSIALAVRQVRPGTSSAQQTQPADGARPRKPAPRRPRLLRPRRLRHPARAAESWSAPRPAFGSFTNRGTTSSTARRPGAACDPDAQTRRSRCATAWPGSLDLFVGRDRAGCWTSSGRDAASAGLRGAAADGQWNAVRRCHGCPHQRCRRRSPSCTHSVEARAFETRDGGLHQHAAKSRYLVARPRRTRGRAGEVRDGPPRRRGRRTAGAGRPRRRSLGGHARAGARPERRHRAPARPSSASRCASTTRP